MNKVKPFFWVEIGASEKRADVRKICDKRHFHLPNQFLGKVIYMWGNDLSPPPLEPDRLRGLPKSMSNPTEQ